MSNGLPLNFNIEDITIDVAPVSIRLIQSRFGEQIEISLARQGTGEKLLTWVNRSRGAQLQAIKRGLLVVTDGRLHPGQKVISVTLTARGKVLWKGAA